MKILPSILIADSSVNCSDIYKSVFVGKNVELIRACFVLDALPLIQGKKIALVLLDFSISEKEVDKFLNTILTGREEERIPVILTADRPVERHLLNKYFEQGVADFIIKPFTNGILSAKVNFFLDLFSKMQKMQEVQMEKDSELLKLSQINNTLTEQNTFSKLLLKAVPWGLQIVDEQGDIIFQSESLSKQSKPGGIGKKCWEMYDGNKSQCPDCPLLKGFEEGEVIVRKAIGIIEGKVFQVYHTGMILQKRKTILQLFQDITEPTIAHEALRIDDDCLRNIIENLPMTLFVKEAKELRYVQFNKAGEELLGCSKTEILGKQDHEIFAKENADNFVEKDRKAMATGLMVDILDESLKTKNNGERIIHTRKIPLYNKNGEPEYLLGLVEDVSLRKQAEEELNNLFELSADMVCIIDNEKGTFKKVNPAFTKILGYPMEYFTGNSITRCIHLEDKHIAERFIEQKFKQSISDFAFENRYCCSDGSVRWLKWTLHITPEKGVTYAIGHDITQRKQKEEALRESEKMYRTLLNASPEGIIILDLKGRITEVSNIALEIFGVENRAEFIGQLFFYFIPNEEVEKMKDVLKKTQSEGLVQNIEFILSKKNQIRFICEISTTLIQEADGKPKAYMAVIRDISQRKKIEQKLIRTERMACLGEMASAMAHEINQPLLSITLGMENLFLKMQKINVVDEKYLKTKSEKVFEDVQRIGRIIDHVRAFSRDQDDFIATSFSVNESIMNAVSMISEQYKNRSITLSLKLEKKTPKIVGNTFKFEQVILNLLSNAKDALEDKQKTMKQDFDKIIEIKTYYDTYSSYVEVKDNGIGIRTEDVDKVMLPFYTTKEVGKGTGLGLSISFSIIKEHNGNIEVESEPSKGSLFRISLPVGI